MELALGLALSTHLLAGDWNEVHPYGRLAFPVTESVSVAAGAFLNSEGNVSATLGLSGGEAIWWELGVATGYSGGAVVPFGRAGFEVGRVRPFIAPAYNVGTGEVGAVLGIEIDLFSHQ